MNFVRLGSGSVHWERQVIAYQPKGELLSREVSFTSVWPFVRAKNNRYNSHQWLLPYCVPGPVRFIFYSKAGCFSAVFRCSPIWSSNKVRRSVASLGFSYWDLVAQLSPDLLGSWTKVLFTWFWFWITPPCELRGLVSPHKLETRLLFWLLSPRTLCYLASCSPFQTLKFHSLPSLHSPAREQQQTGEIEGTGLESRCLIIPEFHLSF